MAHYNIFRQELGFKYSAYGHPLWEPSPGALYPAVEIGDVGFIREGKFHRLFNALLPGDHQSHQRFGVPEHHQPLEVSVLQHIDTGDFSPSNFCSGNVRLSGGGGIYASGPDSNPVSFSCPRAGAILSLPVSALRQDTLARGDFGKWIIKHVGLWFAFTQKLGLGVAHMEDIILVTGCHRARSSANVVFSEGGEEEQVSFNVRVSGVSDVEWRFPLADNRGVALNVGPSGQSLPEDQCIFIRGFRATRFLGILPRLRGAAGQSQSPDEDEPEFDMQLMSIPDNIDIQDPLHTLLEYISTKAPECDMALVHDDDLMKYLEDSSLETLRPDAVMDHLQKSAPQIWQVQCSGSEPETPVVKVATLTECFEASQEKKEWIPFQMAPSKRQVGIAPVSLERSAGAAEKVTMQEMTGEMNKMKRDQLQRDIRSWLSPPDPSENHNIARGTHHSGTSEWFTHGSAFEEWNASGSLLWIHGKPGSGKSILCSTIIQEIEMKSDRGLALMGYYYFDFKDIAKQGIRGLLTSILAQLCAKSDSCYQILSDLYSENNAGSQQPDNRTLTECLKKTLRLPQQPTKYMIVDAIDECPNTSGIPTAREEVLDLLEELVGLNLPGLRICVISRPEIDIQAVLEPLKPLHVSLHNEIGQKQDILNYISAFVHSDRRMRRWRSEDKQLVIDVLSAKANGMFRWVYCQLETLRRCFPAMILCALDELPETLDETYKLTLLGIEKEKREFAHRLLQCLTVAVRPLQIEELAEVLAIRFDSGQLPQYHGDWRSLDTREAVLSACSSLITVVNIDGSPVVQFSHFSVKEFLTSERLAKSTEDLSCFHVLPDAAHAILARASLSVLLYLGDRVDKNRIKNIPFAQYAAQHWVDHARSEIVLSGLQDTMERLFDIDEPSFATWLWIYDIDYPFRRHMFKDHPTRPEAAPLYYAALCGFRGLVEHLIAVNPGDINAIGGHYGSAVNAALMKDHFEIALHLLEHGANVDAWDMQGQTPLHRAIGRRRCDYVRFLLEHHADINLKDGNDETPLFHAVRDGEVEIALLLLRHGAVVDSQTKDGSTPLKVASRYGHLDIVRLLIQCGAALEVPDNRGSTPLMSASRYGHLDIMRLLIQSGAAVDSRDREGWTPLMFASQNGHLDVVQLLTQNGAAVDCPDNTGWTPVMFASEFGYLDVLQFLIQSGAAVGSRDRDGNTPLAVASRCGQVHIAQELLDHGAPADTQDNHLSTPLHLASAKGHLSIVQLLTEHHADINKRNEDQQIPLHCATAHGQLEISRLLLKCGSSINSQDSYDLTPLHLAARHRHLAIVKLLIESGADVNIRDKRDNIPLEAASVTGNHEVTRYLAEHMGIIDHSRGVTVAKMRQ